MLFASETGVTGNCWSDVAAATRLEEDFFKIKKSIEEADVSTLHHVHLGGRWTDDVESGFHWSEDQTDQTTKRLH